MIFYILSSYCMIGLVSEAAAIYKSVADVKVSARRI